VRRAQRRLVILARWPAPGRCKSRLASEVGAARAAAVQQRLTTHVVAAARQACSGSIELLLACSGLGPGAAARWGAELGLARVVDQGQGSLGLRLRRQVVRAGREGVRQIVLIGSDLPELSAAELLAAFRALESGQAMVLGPARDGGYWLLGLDLRRAAAAVRLFCGAEAAIAWGGDRVCEQTRQAAAREGISALLLPCRADLDRPEDLERWR